MKIFLVVLGIVVVIISLLVALMSWWAFNNNKRMGVSHPLSPKDKRSFGNPGAGLKVALLGIILGIVLVIIGSQ